jgi:hypothetical protein
VHGGNLYVSAGIGNTGLRRKQKVLAALALSLDEALRDRGVSKEIICCITEILQAESEQLSLMLDGGSPSRTFRAERKVFEVLHGEASGAQHFFRALSMIPALLLPPRWFYAGRNWLGKREWYRGMRQKALPIPHIASVASSEEFKN